MPDAVETMAWTGAVPWHGLGNQVDKNLTPQEMLVAAGLNWRVDKRKIGYFHEGELIDVDGKSALVRSTDGKLLDVVNDTWQHVQNEDAFRFFTSFVGAGGATMETAGSLQGGRRIWGLARLGADFELPGHDKVMGYLLLTSAHITGYATVARVTPIRVVCANTLALALRGQAKFEARFTHSSSFDPIRAVEAIGIARESILEFAKNAEMLRKCKMSEKEVINLLAPVYCKPNKVDEVREIGLTAAGTSLKSVMQCYYGAPGAQPGNAWGVLAAVTRHADYMAGSGDADARMTSAWLGTEARRKNEVLERLLEIA